MKVLNPEYRWYNYRIWGSDDGENYDLVQDVSGGWIHTVVTTAEHPYHIRPLTKKYKHIRFYIESNLYKTPIQISRLEIYSEK